MTQATDIKQAGEQIVDSGIDLTQNVAKDSTATVSQAKRAAEQVADQTTRVIEDSTNHTLEFFGVSMDIDTLIANSIELSVKIVLALIVFFVGRWIGKKLVKFARSVMERSSMDATVANFVGNLLYGVMLMAVILAALNKLGVNTNSFVAILGGAAVAIGMSLKDQLSNLAAGVMIVIFRPFGRGDYVEVGGKTGTVVDITLVNTRICTPDNHEVIIPNGDIMTSSSINYTSLTNRRVPIVVGISYSADIRKARQIMIQVAKEHKLVLSDPEPIVRVTELADSAVNLTLYVWSDNDNWFVVQCDLLEQVKYAFDDAKVDIPYPNRTVHIEGLDKIAEKLSS
ncbi:mechanosensitive ion channel [Moraxella nasovis]|uniref:mechanosensitive ion channel family protein n=1 Tax=Moraxella nasovis TaxID=2904121 RepID=UPI001F61E3DE|nr:mechanosensitive ion channel domain-containing protein [Moraxella nasovis]UNU73252.1 mechanosensitive ion channel [Moraxella nasovis]